MTADQSQQTLERTIADAAVTLDCLTPAQGLRLMFDFYRRHRAEDCPPENDGDMLLFQWGNHDWGDGRFFEFDLTRQFIIGGNSEDENIWQLSLTFKFLPTDGLDKMESGSKWCHEPRPRAVDHFEGFVWNSTAYLAVSELKPAKAEIDYFNAG